MKGRTSREALLRKERDMQLRCEVMWWLLMVIYVLAITASMMLTLRNPDVSVEEIIINAVCWAVSAVCVVFALHFFEEAAIRRGVAIAHGYFGKQYTMRVDGEYLEFEVLDDGAEENGAKGGGTDGT